MKGKRSLQGNVAPKVINMGDGMHILITQITYQLIHNQLSV